ncbi:unnamed protein product [Periconia digitata]|uniref:Uncharacterized protein n=1 Tax=Periconia digitata TaxID=1303443 RepID=A0A9W4UL15_9PLEO|nr:unnamed protein product [Periconia digitata]
MSEQQTPQSTRKRTARHIASDDELESSTAKAKKTAAGKKQVDPKPAPVKMCPSTAAKPKPGKLAKSFMAHRKIAIPKAPQITRNSTNVVLPGNPVRKQKVSVGANIEKGYDPFRRRDIIDDAKKVTAELATQPVLPEDKMDTFIDKNDPEYEIIHSPLRIRYVRVTTKPINSGGEKALLDDVRKNPGHYPHITFEQEKDALGRLVYRRRKIDPEHLEELREAERERQAAASRAASRANKRVKQRKDKSAIDRARKLLTSMQQKVSDGQQSAGQARGDSSLEHKSAHHGGS